MTNVLVCVKRVPDASGEVTLTPDGLGIDGRYAGYTTSAHEECAVEIATQVADATGGSVTVLTLGNEDAVEQLRGALAVGASDGIHLLTDTPDAYGPVDIAATIASAVRDRETAGTAYGLVLLGNDAADTGDFQVGIRLAYALDRPVVTGVQSVTVDGDRAELRADGTDGTDVYNVELPLVATVLEGSVAPRYPSLTGRMKAKKAPIETIEAAPPVVGSGRVSLSVPPSAASHVTILGEGPAAAPAVVTTLKELGVLR